MKGLLYDPFIPRTCYVMYIFCCASYDKCIMWIIDTHNSNHEQNTGIWDVHLQKNVNIPVDIPYDNQINKQRDSQSS